MQIDRRIESSICEQATGARSTRWRTSTPRRRKATTIEGASKARAGLEAVASLAGVTLGAGLVRLPRAAQALSSVDAGDTDLVEAVLDGLLLSLVREPNAPRASADPRMARAIARIHVELAEPLTVDDLARTARMSRYHFSRVFRAETCQSPYQFLQERRLSRAAELLRASGHNVTEAALLSGFTDLSRYGAQGAPLLLADTSRRVPPGVLNGNTSA